MSDELVPAGVQADVVGTAHMVDGELVVRMRPSGVRDVVGRPVVQDPSTRRIGCLTYMGPLTGRERVKFYAAIARWERRQRLYRWFRWGSKRQEAAR